MIFDTSTWLSVNPELVARSNSSLREPEGSSEPRTAGRL